VTIHKLTTPISEREIRELRIKDIFFVSGTVVTARDLAHKRALEFSEANHALPLSLEGLAIFHCGPVVRKQNGDWVVVAAGPTTSSRMEVYESEFLRRFKPRVVIGKGGMGGKTTRAMAKYGAVYGAFTGGAAVLGARAVKKVKDAVWLDLGMPEAMWVFEVDDLGPMVVAIDASGNNLFSHVAAVTEMNRKGISERLGL
jgi:fumarate hydratase subunit beta